MKIKFINPSRKKINETDFFSFDFINRILERAPYPPLAIPTLAGLTPKNIDISFTDENIENIDFDENSDLVALTAMSPYATRAYEIATEFRKRNVKVILGGIHASMFPNEALKYVDSVVIGEAEDLWPIVAQDAKQGNLKKIYRAKKRPDIKKNPPPRVDILNHSKYINSSIQTSRGCPFDCDFCSVKAFLGPNIRTKNIEQVIGELNNIPKYSHFKILGREIKVTKLIIFVDDNIIGNQNYAKNLFKALIPLNLPGWACQISINIANDKEMLELMKEAGCKHMYIGFESISQESLNSFRKQVNKIEDYEKSIETINSYGIKVNGFLILGGDGDDDTIFEKTVKFIKNNNFNYCTIFILTPEPGTRLFARFESEDRLLHKNWHEYDGKTVVFKPKNMPPEVLQEGFNWVYKQIYSANSIIANPNLLRNLNDTSLNTEKNSIVNLLLTLIFSLKLLLSREDKETKKLIISKIMQGIYKKNLDIPNLFDALTFNDFTNKLLHIRGKQFINKLKTYGNNL